MKINVIEDIKQAGISYLAAEQSQIGAISEMYAIYKIANSNPNVGRAWREKIDEAYTRVKLTSPNAPETKHLSNKIAWISGIGTKQRVSDVHKLISAAHKLGITSDDFAEWIWDIGGIRSTLNSLRASSTPQTTNSQSDSDKRYEQINQIIFDVLENAKHKQISENNSSGVALCSGEIVIQITEHKPNSQFSLCTLKLTKDEMLYFPKKVVTSFPKLDEEKSATFDELAASATLADTDDQQPLPNVA